jgi:hypothetical protein
MASQTVTVVSCADRGPRGPLIEDEADHRYSILAIGDACTVRGSGAGDHFRPESGTLCTLAFAEGTRTLRVTYASMRFGIEGGVAGRTYIDPSYVELQVAGDDRDTGMHAVYRFSGTAIRVASSAERCNAPRSTGTD